MPKREPQWSLPQVQAWLRPSSEGWKRPPCKICGKIISARESWRANGTGYYHWRHRREQHIRGEGCYEVVWV